MNDALRTDILSLALDLKRITVGYQNNSLEMMGRFQLEADRWLRRIEPDKVAPYIAKIIGFLPEKLVNPDEAQRAEDALTYSVILQNYALTKLKE